jgi:excisionase family DNA binding protein
MKMLHTDSPSKSEPPGEAARLAGLGRTTIYSALGSGALKSIKIGKRRLITMEASLLLDGGRRQRRGPARSLSLYWKSTF